MMGRRATLLAVAFTALLVPAHAGFAATLELNRTIRTSPFTGTSVSMGDNEGSAFVPSDNSLWLADDNKNTVYAVDPTTGALKRTIPRSAFINAPKFGGGPAAGTERTNDFESIAYNRRRDVLYVFSGACCTSSTRATAFRLRRRSGRFRVVSYQPLPTGADYTAAAWSPTDDKLYVGKGKEMRSFNYATGTASAPFSVDGIRGILGMDFGPAGGESLRHGQQRTADPDRLGDEDGRERVDIRPDAFRHPGCSGRREDPGPVLRERWL